MRNPGYREHGMKKQPPMHEVIAALLQKMENPWQAEQILGMEKVVPDGSTRRFYRVRGPDNTSLICLRPQGQTREELAEARAFYTIGNHLATCGVAVPKMYGFCPKTGMVACEDLGTTRLYDLVHDPGAAEGTVETAYEQTVRQLAVMQVFGGRGFQRSWCWDTPVYDRSLMIERESDYFFKAFCTDYLGIETGLEQARSDCRLVAEQASRASTSFFLHRDFQSRNIMLTDDRPRFIDFQGGRLGPLAYDLASLLIDPYSCLSASRQEQLVLIYFDELKRYQDYTFDRLQHEYLFLALQRNLQILGAFAFLSRVRKKLFFARFVPQALTSLADLLAKPGAAEYGGLRTLTNLCLKRHHQQDR